LLLCAAFVAHMAAELQGEVPLLMVLCWFMSNAFEALVGAALIRGSIRGPFSFERLHHVVAFILFGALFASFVSSFLDAAFVKMAGWGQTEYWELWCRGSVNRCVKRFRRLSSSAAYSWAQRLRL